MSEQDIRRLNYKQQPDTSPQSVRNGESYDLDTREQLEADVASILRNAASHTSINTSIGDMLRYTVPGSGAAPWQTAEDACEALASIIESQLAELTAERDELREALDACGTGTMYELWRKDHAQLEAIRAALHVLAASIGAFLGMTVLAVLMVGGDGQ